MTFFFLFGDQLHFRVVDWPSSALERQLPFFFGDQLHCHDILRLSQCHCNHCIKVFMKVGHKNLWLLEWAMARKRLRTTALQDQGLLFLFFRISLYYVDNT